MTRVNDAVSVRDVLHLISWGGKASVEYVAALSDLELVATLRGLEEHNRVIATKVASLYGKPGITDARSELQDSNAAIGTLRKEAAIRFARVTLAAAAKSTAPSNDNQK